MEKAYIQRHNDMQMVHRTLPTYRHDLTENFDTQFRHLPAVVAYDIYFVDPQNGLQPCWHEDLHDQDELEYKDS